MRKFLIVLALTMNLTAFARPAKADPITALVSTAWGWLTGGSLIAGIVTQIGISLVLSQLVSMNQKSQDILRQLQLPNSLPAKRFVYRKTWAPGTPAPVRVKGSKMYACYILNSRASAGPFTLLLDKRVVEVNSGDPYDFSGPGASATNEPFSGHCKYWIGRGDQTSPPTEILSSVPELFSVTDAWQGLTVIWLVLDAGKAGQMQERWPATPPEVFVDGYWSLVSDPRDPEAPPAWSANQALCVLDALKNNPLRSYDDRNLYLELFAWSADIADEPFAVKSGGFIPKFETNGVLAFTTGSELEDQIMPLVSAGASRLIRVGGRLGLIPAVYSAPTMTFNHVLTDQPMTFNRYRPSSELYTEVQATYTSPERFYEEAATPVYVLDGAQAEDGGEAKLGQFNLRFITDHRQAQYVAAILGRRTRMQRSVSAMLPANAFDLIACSTLTYDFPSPYTTRNGIYEVEEIHPGGDVIGKSGFAMRCFVVSRETEPEIYYWTPAEDEQDAIVEEYTPAVAGVSPPGTINLVSDETTVLISGNTYIARVLFSFDPSSSSSVTSYQWDYTTGFSWQTGGSIAAEILNGSGDVFGYIIPAEIGEAYKVRVKAVSPNGESDYIESDFITASAGSYLASPPTPISAIADVDSIAVTFQAPNEPAYAAMEIFVSTVDDSSGATLLFGPIYGAANSEVSRTHEGLGSSETYFYFARSRDTNGQASPFSASISATTP